MFFEITLANGLRTKNFAPTEYTCKNVNILASIG